MTQMTNDKWLMSFNSHLNHLSFNHLPLIIIKNFKQKFSYLIKFHSRTVSRDRIRAILLDEIDFRVYFFSDLWDAISREPMIGFMRFWTFMKALVALYMTTNFQLNWSSHSRVIASQRLGIWIWLLDDEIIA